MRKVLDDDGVVNSVVTGSTEAERAQERVPGVPDFTVDEEEPAAIGGAKGGPSARVDPEAYAGGDVEGDEDEEGGVITAGRVRLRGKCQERAGSYRLPLKASNMTGLV